MTKYKIIEKFSEFERLDSAWNELVVHSDVDQVFMRHEWFLEWIKSYNAKDSLAVVTIWSDGQLTAVAPLYRRQFVFRKVKARGLSFLSSGVSPRCNFITADDSSLNSLVQHTLALKDWDVLITENMEEEIGTTGRYCELLASMKKRYSFKVDRGLHSPYMMTQGTWEDYWNALGKKRQKYLKKTCIRGLEKAESHEVFKATTAGQFAEFGPLMFKLSAESWKFTVGSHLTQDSATGKMYTNFTPIAMKNGWAVIYFLKINREIVGFDYLLTYKGTYTGIRSDHNASFNYYSPGHSLKLAVIKEFFSQSDALEYDFGGDAEPYKLQWCNRIRKHVSITVGNRNFMGKTVLYIKKTLLPAARGIAGLLKPVSK